MMLRASHVVLSLSWRYWMFLALCGLALPLCGLLSAPHALMAGFDIAVLAFVASLYPVFGHDEATMRTHLRQIEAKREVMLMVTGIVMLVILVLVWSELSQRSALTGVRVLLVLITLSLAWLFSNLIYTLHYAYLFYRGGHAGKDAGGLDFPGESAPGYWDFTYFAFTLGMTFQTSDVAITSGAMRKIVTVHCLAAFIFNLGIIAFTINTLGGG